MEYYMGVSQRSGLCILVDIDISSMQPGEDGCQPSTRVRFLGNSPYSLTRVVPLGTGEAYATRCVDWEDPS